MFVEQADQASTIPMFDEASAAVFACLCRLTDGDGARAQELLVETFVTASSAADVANSVTDLVDIARRLHLAADRSPDHVERVVADMHLVDHRPISDIAAVVDQSADLVAVIVDSLATAPHADLRSGEIWFDDARRSEAQLAIADRLPGFDGSTSVRRSRRRAVIGAALAAGAALIALTIWVRSGNEAGDTASLPTTVPSTTSAPTSTTSAPTTTAADVDTTDVAPTDFTVPDETIDTSLPESDPVGFILDPPLPGFVEFGAGFAVFGGGGGEPPFPLSVWATSDAGPASGRWLALEVDVDDASIVASESGDQQRLEIAGDSALMTTSPLGVHRFVVSKGEGNQIETVSYGIDPDKVVALIAATTPGPNDLPTFGADAAPALDGLDLIASTRTDQSGLGMSTFVTDGTSVLYQNSDSGASFAITTSPQAPNDLLLASLVFGNPHETTREVVSIDGRQVVVATRVFEESHTVKYAMWHAGANTISLGGLLSSDELTLAIRSTRRATEPEWQELEHALPPPSTYEETPPEGPEHSEEIGAVTASDTSSWTFRLSDLDVGLGTASVLIDQLSTPDASSSYLPELQNQLPLSIDPNNALTRFETTRATILVAAFDGPTAATSMRVTLYRRTPVTVPIVAVPETTLSGAAYVFSELVPYTVELLDANGAVLQTLA